MAGFIVLLTLTSVSVSGCFPGDLPHIPQPVSETASQQLSRY